MKKTIVSVLFVLSFAAVSFAQVPVKKESPVQKKEAMKTEKKETPKVEKKAVVKHHAKHHSMKKKTEGAK